MAILFRTQLSEEDVRRSAVYVENHYSDYSDTNQRNPEKLRAQNLAGKLAEIATEHFAVLCGATVVRGTSFQELPVSQRSFASDLVITSKLGVTQAVHVKGQPLCSVRSLNCITWVLQKDSIRGRRDRQLLDAREGYIALAVASHSGYVWLLVLRRAADLIPQMLKEPLVEKLRGDKACLYFRDMVSPEEYDVVYREVSNYA